MSGFLLPVEKAHQGLVGFFIVNTFPVTMPVFRRYHKRIHDRY
ncbi:hypothetical protein BMY_1413 [Wohlfahrtiimonas chitiniclastica]|nr:hypothetical protein BMY_1413 [Wohlfahrtiimonas chitiniclastica]